MSCKCKQMNKIKIKYQKLHSDAVQPAQAHDEDAGYDMVCVDDGTKKFSDKGTYLYTEYKTGIAIQPEIGYHVEIMPRSSITAKELMLKNSVGLIDRIYTGEIRFRFFETYNGSDGIFYKKGDKIGQIVIRKTIYADFLNEPLEETVRGEGGFGSTTGQLYIIASGTDVGKSSFKKE